MKFNDRIKVYEDSKPYDNPQLVKRRGEQSNIRQHSAFLRKIGAVVLSSAALFGGAAFIGNAYDHSPTTELQQSYKDAEQKQTEQKAAEIHQIDADNAVAEHMQEVVPDDSGIHVYDTPQK
jgi:hypothetical protein